MNPGPDGAAEGHLLFVYGTLRRGCELHHHLTRLAAKFRAEGKVAAERIDGRRYPGATSIAPARELGSRRSLPTAAA